MDNNYIAKLKPKRSAKNITDLFSEILQKSHCMIMLETQDKIP